MKTQIKGAMPKATVTTAEDLADQVSGSLSTASQLAAHVGKWLSIAVLVAAFLVAGLLTSSAVSRRVREFGTLKALGWASRRIVRQVRRRGRRQGCVGGALGIALGLAAPGSHRDQPQPRGTAGHTGSGPCGGPGGEAARGGAGGVRARVQGPRR